MEFVQKDREEIVQGMREANLEMEKIGMKGVEGVERGIDELLEQNRNVDQELKRVEAR